MTPQPLITTEEFIRLLEQHDWYFDRSDDPKAYAAGSQSQKTLLYLCQQQPELFRFYNHADNCIIRNVPFNFPSVIGFPVTVEKQQHIQTKHQNTIMKPIFTELFEICIRPLVEAIDRLAASGNIAGAALTKTAPVEAPAAEEKPATEKPAKVKKEKAAPAPEAPAAEPAPAAEESAAPAITEARMKATVKTLDEAGRNKMKEFITKKLGAQSIAELSAEQYARVHAAALKLGATDTDPDAEKDEFADL